MLAHVQTLTIKAPLPRVSQPPRQARFDAQLVHLGAVAGPTQLHANDWSLPHPHKRSRWPDTCATSKMLSAQRTPTDFAQSDCWFPHLTATCTLLHVFNACMAPEARGCRNALINAESEHHCGALIMHIADYDSRVCQHSRVTIESSACISDVA
eukprot:1748985-Amphidinium_carterae.1